MLTGRESLSTLIGKRPCFLPNFQSILSSPIQSSLNLLSDKNGSLVETERPKGKVERSKSDWVTCPVCGKKVSDGCLSRRIKRKLTQRTLLQLKFGCSQSKVQISSGEPEQLLNSDFNKSHCDSEENTTHGFSKISPSEDKSHDQRRQLLHTESVKQIDGYVTAVPTQIVCPNTISNGEKRRDSFDVSKHLWQKAHRVAEFARNSSTQYNKISAELLSVTTGGFNK